jgi:hypothetical protein
VKRVQYVISAKSNFYAENRLYVNKDFQLCRYKPLKGDACQGSPLLFDTIKAAGKHAKMYEKKAINRGGYDGSLAPFIVEVADHCEPVPKVGLRQKWDRLSGNERALFVSLPFVLGLFALSALPHSYPDIGETALKGAKADLQNSQDSFDIAQQRGDLGAMAKEVDRMQKDREQIRGIEENKGLPPTDQ